MDLQSFLQECNIFMSRSPVAVGNLVPLAAPASPQPLAPAAPAPAAPAPTLAPPPAPAAPVLPAAPAAGAAPVMMAKVKVEITPDEANPREKIQDILHRYRVIVEEGKRKQLEAKGEPPKEELELEPEPEPEPEPPTVATGKKMKKGKKGKKRDRVDARATKELQDQKLWECRQWIGNVPGVVAGDQFISRFELRMVNLHRQSQAGIDTMFSEQLQCRLAIAVVTMVDDHQNSYKDDSDNGEELVYSGQGGGNPRTKEKDDQKEVRGNAGLIESYKQGIPVRVIRGYRGRAAMDTPFKVIYSYDGLYIVKEFKYEQGVRGNQVYKFRMQRMKNQPVLRMLRKPKAMSAEPVLCPVPVSLVNPIVALSSSGSSPSLLEPGRKGPGIWAENGKLVEPEPGQDGTSLWEVSSAGSESDSATLLKGKMIEPGLLEWRAMRASSALEGEVNGSCSKAKAMEPGEAGPSKRVKAMARHSKQPVTISPVEASCPNMMKDCGSMTQAMSLLPQASGAAGQGNVAAAVKSNQGVESSNGSGWVSAGRSGGGAPGAVVAQGQPARKRRSYPAFETFLGVK